MKKLIYLFILSGFSLSQAKGTTYQVTTTASSGAGSLKEAIFLANADVNEPHTITADASLAGTIVYTSTDTLKRDMTIFGPMAGGLSVSGNDAVRIIYIQSGVNVSISNLTFHNGTINNGGAAITNYGGNLILENCSFENNAVTSTGQGGAIWNGMSGNFIATNCTFKNNSTNSFGGAVTLYSAATFTNCTFYGNTASSSNGGGAVMIYGNDGGQGTFINCTITGNVPDGIYSDGNNKATLVNTIITGNGNDLVGTALSDYSVFGNNPSITGTKNQINIAAADVFGTNLLTNNGGITETIAILRPSPAADSGTADNGAPPTDQRGMSRDTKYDVGAYEFQVSNALLNAWLHGETTVFTNPSDRLFFLNISDQVSGNIEWVVLGTDGKTILTNNIVKGRNAVTYDIDLGNHAPGTYYLMITSGEARATKQLIKL